MLVIGVTACGNADSAKIGGGRLADSPSPYLQMHADNPVEWYPWGEEAFARARRENKPIFLSIGYSTCYWCHVMERESFENDEVAKELNAHFISIKVDREARPDVDDIYMTAVQLMQNRGGWPMSSFLTPDLKPFFGGTYYPRAQFLQLLASMNRAWENDREMVQRQAGMVADAVAAAHAPRASKEVPAGSAVSAAVDQLRIRYDAKDGGFGGAPKFPTPAQLELLLDRHEATQDKTLLAMVSFTLTRMARGGIHDQLGLGFHRYSTDARWQVPHFEKMLYDNAQLLHLYARAYKLTGDPVFALAARDIVALMETTFRSPEGLWYSAMDAETDSEEGRYYVWTRDELRASLDDSEWKLAERVWGLDRHPNFEGGRFVLAWADDYRDTARTLGLSVDALFSRMEAIQGTLLQARAQRTAPLVDEKIVVGWNGLAIDALAYSGAAMKNPEWVQRAKSAAATLLAKSRTAHGLAHMLRDGKPHGQAVLEDYAGLLLGLTGVATAAKDEDASRQAIALADEMIARLWDNTQGGFYDAQASATDLIVRPRSQYDGAIPAGNSLAAQALLRLVNAGQARYRPNLTATFAAFGESLVRQPGRLTAMASALDAYHKAGGPTQAPPVALASTDSASTVKVAVRRADSGTRIVQLTIADGWHVNANPASRDFLIPTEVRVTRGGQAFDIDVEYPDPKSLDAGLPGGALRVYSGTAEIRAKARGASLDGVALSVRVQACDDHGVCLAPSEIVVRE